MLNIDTSKPVDRTGNAFCGPLVVAAILGTSTGRVASALAAVRQENHGVVKLGNGRAKRVRNRTTESIRGTYPAELETLLASYGYSFEPVDVGARFRMARKLRGRPSYVNDAGTRFACPNPPLLSTETWHPWTVLEHCALPLWQGLSRLRDGGTYIVFTPGHWALAHNGHWCETFTNGNWVRFSHAPKSSRRMLAAWRVTQ